MTIHTMVALMGVMVMVVSSTSLIHFTNDTGTHVAGIVAGNMTGTGEPFYTPVTPFLGVAPQATLLICRLSVISFVPHSFLSYFDLFSPDKIVSSGAIIEPHQVSLNMWLYSTASFFRHTIFALQTIQMLLLMQFSELMQTTPISVSTLSHRILST